MPYTLLKKFVYYPLRSRIAVADRFLFTHPFKLAGSYPPWTYPRTLGIALTRNCNLSCFMCRSPEAKGEDLDFDNLVKLEPAIRHAEIIEFCGEGESLGYRRIEDTLEFIYSLNHRIRLLRIFTNGTTLSRSMAVLLSGRVHYMRISLNAATPETYHLVTRKGNLGITIGCIEDFLSALDEPDRSRIYLHFVASTVNYQEIPLFVELSCKLGIRHVSVGNIEISRKVHECYSLLNIQDEYDETIVRARKTARHLGILLEARSFADDRGSGGAANNCEMLYNAFVELDGGISPCNNSGRYRIGNVYKDEFEEAWFCAEYVALRRNQYMPACDSCIYHMPLSDEAAHFTCHFKDAPR
jgi:MoaA/NifB/PqqE/SkfB family radical SAM enzyme